LAAEIIENVEAGLACFREIAGALWSKEQRVKFINIAKQAISIERKRELDLYKLFASDADFKRAFVATIARLLVI
jgi:hypothetical protein